VSGATSRPRPRRTAAAVAAALLAAAAGCENTPPRGIRGTDPAAPSLIELKGTVMSTTFMAKAWYRVGDPGVHRADLARALDAAERVERLMSRFRPDSDVSRLSARAAGRPLKVDPWTLEILKLSREVHARSGGAFDVTVGPLVRLYKYTGREEKRLPTDAEIAAARALVGTDRLKLDEAAGTAAVGAGGMVVDLSAVAKGFAVDKALEALREGGAVGGLAEVGGEVRSFGGKPGGAAWTVGVRHPRSGDLVATLELPDRAIATSGDYQKFFRQGGKRASHIIDPRTGRPLVGGAVSVTVLAPSCALADALATAISVLGPAEGLALAGSYRKEGLAVEALIIEETAAGKLVPHASPGLATLKLDI
jgi:thiamine biosynthesis lipoprotein